MSNSKSRFVRLAALVILLLAAAPALAQNIKSYVSSTGSNANPCTFTLPCASFQTAIDNSYAGETVSCLDSGDFTGLIAITKSIVIDCEGTSASAVTFAINGAGIVVTIRHLQMRNSTVGFGIDFQNGAALYVENCVIRDQTEGSGIAIHFAPPAGVTAKLRVTDSVIKNNGGGASGGGIIIQPAGSGSARVVIERTQVEGNLYGIFANGTGSTGNIIVHVKDSVVSNSTVGGVSAYTSAGHSVVAIAMDRSSSLLNGADGILSQSSNAYVLLSNATVLSNVTGLHSVSGGNILSYQNNTVTGNVSDGATTGVLTVK